MKEDTHWPASAGIQDMDKETLWIISNKGKGRGHSRAIIISSKI